MDTIEQVNQDLAAINRVWQDPESLSALILRISLKYGELGDLVSEAEGEMDAQKERYEYDVAKQVIQGVKDGRSVASSEAEAKIDYREAYRLYLTAKKNYGSLKRKRDSVEKIIDAARSRLALIRSDMRLQP